MSLAGACASQRRQLGRSISPPPTGKPIDRFPERRARFHGEQTLWGGKQFL